ncbi:MAG: serine hydrolase [Cyanobacteria bacterium J06642_11]
MLNLGASSAEAAALVSSLAGFSPRQEGLPTFPEASLLSGLDVRNRCAVDPLYGSDRADLLFGGEGAEQLYGRKGSDILSGADGHDTLFGNQDGDWLWGGRGDDHLNGGEADDVLFGGSGDDSLIGGSGRDWLLGGSGSDSLKGSSGNDHLRGGKGQDRLAGGTGEDWLDGGTGDDILIDRDGGDRLTGGPGADQFWLRGSTLGATQITDFQVGHDRIKFLDLALTPEGLTLADSAAGAVIQTADATLAILTGVEAEQLTEESFIWGNAETADDLQAVIDQVLQSTELPGTSVAVTAPDGTLWSGVGGVADLSQQTPMTPTDRFQIGSITKPMVATVVLQLMQEGRLSLSDTLTDWLPASMTDGLAGSDHITLRHLLNHTSGIPDFYQPLLTDIVQDESLALHPRSNADILTQYVYGQSPLATPGEIHNYSNTNYLLLGEIVEAVTGSSLAASLRSRVFEPLGMDNSFFSPQEAVPGGYTSGYFDAEENGTPSLDVSELNPAFDGDGGHAGVVSTAEDIARFAQGLFGGELLAPKTLHQMTADVVPTDEETFYGLGINVDPAGYTALFHGGGWLGWSGQMLYLPEQAVTISVLLNMQNQDPTQPGPGSQIAAGVGLSLIENFWDDFP